jgi:hypothetical protein
MTTTSSKAAGASRLLDASLALAAGAGALGLYLATVQPGFGGPEDTPKFQFVGYVLGLPHPPGYPLYVLLSHIFVQLPVGTIAYRANLFSAVMAAAACTLAFAIGRQMGVRRAAALCGAAGLATGASFWRSAVFAEVYSLAAVMAGLTIVLLLQWRKRGGAGWLLASAAAFSLGLGNHLTILGLAPACAGYVLWRNRRVVTPRVIAGVLVLLLAGVAQYGLIVLRTRQDAPYLESRARTVSELVGVITAERFAEQRFAFSLPVLFGDHIPAVLLTIAQELGLAATVLLAGGAIAGLRTRNAEAALVAGAAGGMLAMVVNLVGDLRGFITPVMVFVWPFAALGVDRLAHFVTLRANHRAAAGVVAAAIAAILVPNIARNYKDADQSGPTAEARFLRAVYGWLPDRAGVVVEDYWADMALHYYLLTGEAGPPRGIMRVGFDVSDVVEAARLGHRVFAFGKGSTFLGAQGLRFERAPLAAVPFGEWLGTLPAGTLIVGATADVPPLDLSRAGHLHARPIGRPQAFETFAVVARQPGAAWRKADDASALTVDAAALKASLPASATVRAAADASAARIELDGRTIALVEKGIAMAVFAPDGTLTRALEFTAGEPISVPFQEVVYEFAGQAACVALTDGGWRDVTPALSTGSWVATLYDVGSLTVETEVEHGGGLRTRAAELLGAGEARVISSTDRGDGAHVLRTELSRTTTGRAVFRLALDRPPAAARARVATGGVRSSVTVCSHHPARPLFLPGASLGILRPDFEAESYFGAGWGGAERTHSGVVRHSDGDGTLLLPLDAGYRYRVSLDVVSAKAAAIDVSVNGARIGSCEIGRGTPCELTLERPAVRDGVNAVRLSPHPPDDRGERRSGLTFRGARIGRTR